MFGYTEVSDVILNMYVDSTFTRGAYVQQKAIKASRLYICLQKIYFLCRSIMAIRLIPLMIVSWEDYKNVIKYVR